MKENLPRELRNALGRSPCMKGEMARATDITDARRLADGLPALSEVLK